MLHLFAVNIAPATSVRIPQAVTPQQAASGQTAILYPSAHSHALGQMVCITFVIIRLGYNKNNKDKGLFNLY